MAETNEVTARVGASGFRTEIRTRNHTIFADEPLALGGTDQGPTPYELLSGALGACIAITIRMYADRRGWPLDEVTVRLEHDRAHEQDCEHCEEDEVGLDRLTRFVELTGDLTEEQRAGLLRIAGRCPVGQTLSRGVKLVAAPAREAGEAPSRSDPPQA